MLGKPDHGRVLHPTLPGIFSVLILFLVMISGCEWNPDHDNPADPGSDLFENSGIVSVQTVDAQNRPVQDVVIHASTVENGWTTDTEGVVDIVLDPGDYVISAEKAGYVADPDTITITAKNSISRSLTLYAVPVIDSVKVVFCRSYSDLNAASIDINQIVVSAWVEDSDEEDGALVASFVDPVTQQEYSMSYIMDNMYVGIMNIDQNGYTSIQQRVNIPFVVTIQDNDDHESSKASVIYQVFPYSGLYNAFREGGPISVKADSVALYWGGITGFTFWPTFCYVEIFDEDSESYNQYTDLFIDTLLYNDGVNGVYFEGLDLSEYSNEVFSWRLSLMDAYGNLYRSATKDLGIVAN